MQRIMVVEDDETLGNVLRRRLHLEGFAVTHVESADKALSLAQHDAYALVIVDVKMPGMDGFAFVNELRQMQPSIRVLFMSGYPYDHLCREAIGLDEVAFLQKPFNRQELTTVVFRALGPLKTDRADGTRLEENR
jgi:DNA-binding NtrC family response regulator